MGDEVKVKDAEVTEDGLIMIEFNESLNPAFISKKAVFAPEVLMALAMKYGVIPPKEETDYPGLPFVGGENVDLGADDEVDLDLGTEELEDESNGPTPEV